MVLIRRTPRFTCDNSLVAFINVEEEEFILEEMTQVMVEKLKLISIAFNSVGEYGPSTKEATQKLYCAKRQSRVCRI
jgi:hypothetical protein